MLRYNKQYQQLADNFARKYGEGDWIGAKYLGQYHESRCDALGPGWLAFEPIWKEPDMKVGLFHYILIDEEQHGADGVYGRHNQCQDTEVSRLVEERHAGSIRVPLHKPCSHPPGDFRGILPLTERSFFRMPAYNF